MGNFQTFFSQLKLYTLISYVYVLIEVGICVWAVILKEALVKLQELYTIGEEEELLKEED